MPSPPSVQTSGLAAVIFDFDGVMVDSEPIHYRAFMKVLEPLGLTHSYDLYVERYIGFDDRDAFRAIFEDAGRSLDPNLFEELIQAKQEAFKEIVSRGVDSFPGVHRLVQELQRESVPLAIASGSARGEILLMLRALGLEDAFPVLVTADDVEHSKPDPETYLLAVRLLHEKGFLGFPDENPEKDRNTSGILVIEDTPTGIEAARRAGLPVVAVGHSYPLETLKEADWIVDALADLSVHRLRSFLNNSGPVQ